MVLMDVYHTSIGVTNINVVTVVSISIQSLNESLIVRGRRAVLLLNPPHPLSRLKDGWGGFSSSNSMYVSVFFFLLRHL